MDDHQKALETLCRIYGGKIVLQHGYRTAKSVLKFTDTIAICYGVNVTGEDKNIFPKSLRTKCHQKIKRLNKKSGKSEMCVVASFYQHSDNFFIFIVHSPNVFPLISAILLFYRFWVMFCFLITKKYIPRDIIESIKDNHSKVNSGWH